jgi:hypothetical protein
MSIFLLLVIAAKLVVSNHVANPLRQLECPRLWEANLEKDWRAK